MSLSEVLTELAYLRAAVDRLLILNGPRRLRERPCIRCGLAYLPGTYAIHRLTHPKPEPRTSVPDPRKQERYDRILALFDAGQSGVEIASQVGVTRERVRQVVLRERGISLAANRRCPECGERYEGWLRVHRQKQHASTAAHDLLLRDEEVARLYRAGMNGTAIGRQLSLDVKAIYRALRRQSVERRRKGWHVIQQPWSPTDIALARELRAAGHSLNVIARQMGRPVGSTLHILRYGRTSKPVEATA